MPNQTFAAGALRHKAEDGNWHVTEPHDLMYSTATMLATEYWDTKRGEWRKIFEDDDAPRKD